jgi:predicted metal-dependent HD superfamily phosphohydrolase
MNRYTPELEHLLLSNSDLVATIGEKNLAKVKSMHEVKGRYYHTWDHALDVLTAVLGLGLPDQVRRAHALAAIFHDAVYTVGSTTNEDDSAAFMRKMLEDTRHKYEVLYASDLIRQTSKHWISAPDNISPEHRDFMDCDLLRLSDLCWALVAQLDWCVGAEKLAAGCTLPMVLQSRHSFLKNMLSKPTIYLGRTYGTTREWQARSNLQRLLDYNHDFTALIQDLGI